MQHRPQHQQCSLWSLNRLLLYSSLPILQSNDLMVFTNLRTPLLAQRDIENCPRIGNTVTAPQVSMHSVAKFPQSITVLKELCTFVDVWKVPAVMKQQPCLLLDRLRNTQHYAKTTLIFKHFFKYFFKHLFQFRYFCSETFYTRILTLWPVLDFQHKIMMLC